MNTTTPKRPNKQRMHAYSYYVVSYSMGDSKIYLRTVWGLTGSLYKAVRFNSKSNAKVAMRLLNSSSSPSVSRLQHMHPNILRIRDVSQREVSLQSLVDL